MKEERREIPGMNRAYFRLFEEKLVHPSGIRSRRTEPKHLFLPIARTDRYNAPTFGTKCDAAVAYVRFSSIGVLRLSIFSMLYLHLFHYIINAFSSPLP